VGTAHSRADRVTAAGEVPLRDRRRPGVGASGTGRLLAAAATTLQRSASTANCQYTPVFRRHLGYPQPWGGRSSRRTRKPQTPDAERGVAPTFRGPPATTSQYHTRACSTCAVQPGARETRTTPQSMPSSSWTEDSPRPHERSRAVRIPSRAGVIRHRCRPRPESARLPCSETHRGN
jgi:hypothetical protein